MRHISNKAEVIMLRKLGLSEDRTIEEERNSKGKSKTCKIIKRLPKVS